jgi:phosphoglycolate phosphatase-like HAD superfamily hydrolase
MSKSNHPEALVLFDIDGTLIRRAGPHHRMALIEAVRRVTGLETTTDHIPLHGMLDPEILARMMGNSGATPSLVRQAMPAIIRQAQVYYARSCPDLTRKTCPGVRRLLEGLKARRVPLGLVTGNVTCIGWKKLNQAGLKGYFRFGAFGEMAKDRTGLVRLALRMARAEGWLGRSTRVSLIGDTPADIQAARANRVRAVAVYTGISTPEELAAYQPDLLLENLRRLAPEMLW